MLHTSFPVLPREGGSSQPSRTSLTDRPGACFHGESSPVAIMGAQHLGPLHLRSVKIGCYPRLEGCGPGLAWPL